MLEKNSSRQEYRTPCLVCMKLDILVVHKVIPSLKVVKGVGYVLRVFVCFKENFKTRIYSENKLGYQYENLLCPLCLCSWHILTSL